jgi:hypothetical protein
MKAFLLAHGRVAAFKSVNTATKRKYSGLELS